MPTEAHFGSTLTGSLANDTADIYTFEARAGGELTFQLDFEQLVNQSRSVSLRLVDANGRNVFNKSTFSDKTWHTVIPQAGKHTLAVADAGFVDKNLLDYTVSTLFSTELHTVYERPLHDTAATAMALVTGRPLVGALQSREVDYFKVSTTQAGQLHLNFAHPDGPGADGSRMSLQIIDSATGKVLLSKSMLGSQLQSGNDFVQGSAGDNVFESSPGHDTFSGNGGFDSVQYDRKAADYRLGFSDAGIMVEAVAGTGGRDALFNISRITFADKTVDFGDTTDAAALYRLYDAAFGRTPDEAGMGFWLKELENGISLHQAAHGFVDSSEFGIHYAPTSTHTELVTAFYQNILNRAPDAGGLAFWIDALDAGADVASVLEGFSESAEHQTMLVGQLAHGVTYIPYVA